MPMLADAHTGRDRVATIAALHRGHDSADKAEELHHIACALADMVGLIELRTELVASDWR
ncbi:hypothetical protein J2046_006661 [Rhizobium petrolearium]|uniref:Uncharacterized protein n=2 Tax=Neorhizobium TaxID=1525371 RepID=A0ABV0MDP1_9HYPH|nr:hypothetical protein [Neorhizobium petrolearium]MBP1848370.1 hypothetical protein [Neorhizobium petrolearium]MCC2614506.1 hypothetical protein [Neorhizobium petrolearium]WGI72267.1 hypothetical protein QEO92_32480 [Neorhizobium petrolearium]